MFIINVDNWIFVLLKKYFYTIFSEDGLLRLPSISFAFDASSSWTFSLIPPKAFE